jgi:MFS transporter, Spinster family, sphingosine-1-phosphate transporter
MKRPPSPRVALGLLTGVNLLNYVDRYMPSAVLPSIIAAMHISDAQAGSLQTLFIVTYIIVSPLAGWLGDRQPRFRLAALAILLWSAATFGSGLAPTFLLLVLMRSLIGVGEAGYTVVTPSLLSDFYPAAQRGRALSIFYAAIPVGTALGYVIGGQVDAHLGWRWAFFIAGLPGALLAVILLGLRDPPRGGLDRVSAVRADDHAVTTSATGLVTLLRSARAVLAVLFRRQSWVINTAAQTIFTFTVGGLGAWMPTYFVRIRGLRLSTATTAFGGVLLLAGLVGTLIGGRVGDRLAVRRTDGHFLMSGVALVISTPFTLIALLAPSPFVYWPCMFVTLTLLFLNTGPLNAAMANVLESSLRGRGFAINTVAIHLLGAALSPMLIGLASDRIGLRLPVLFIAVLPIAAGFLLLAGRTALDRDLHAQAAVG